MLQGKVIWIIFICTSSLNVTFSHDPGRSHSGQYRTRGQTTWGPVFPRCLLEKKSAFTLRMISPGSRNVTLFIPRCGLDHSFRCRQEWSAVGLSWQSNKEGRMVENTMTRGKANCPNEKGTLNFKEESKPKEEKDEDEEEQSMIRWYDEMMAICLNSDVGNETKNLRNSSQDVGDDESGRDTDDVDDADYSDESDPADDDDGDTMDEDTDVMDADDDVMGDDDDVDDDGDDFDNGDDDDGVDDGDDDDDDDDDDGDDDNDDDDDDDGNGDGMTHGRHRRRQSGDHRRRRHHRHHFSQLNWIQQQDLYEEFKFNPPSVCPKDQPMQSNCRPNLCKFVKCGEDKNISCRVNPCGTCRPECYDVKRNTAMPPRAFTKCEYRRMKMKYSRYNKIKIIPRCSKDGSFRKVQCLAATKWCWCVDEHGQERNGTRQRGKPSSCKFSGPVLSECQSTQLNIEGLKDYLSKIAIRCNTTANNMKYEAKNATQWTQQRLTAQGTMGHQNQRKRFCRVLARNARREVKHLIKPKCASDGRFEDIQCDSSNQACWCVDENGKRKSSVKTRNKLNCSSSGGQSSNCPLQMARGKVQSSACRDSSDCPDPKVCCKTRRSGRKCVEPRSRIPAVKPGKCPIIPRSSNYTCRSRCKSDTDCRGNRKCCELGCGKRCLPPSMPVCPRDKPFKLCIYDKCLSSPGCASHPSAKCRMNYCGECIAEYFDENDHKVDCSKATKCQKQRHAAIESYKRKYLQLFNTLPLHLPGAPHNTSREAGRHLGNQSGIHSGGQTEGQREGQRLTSVNRQLGGWHGRRGGRSGGHQRNSQGRYTGAQGTGGVRRRGQGSYAGGRNQSRVESGGSQRLGQRGFRQYGRSTASEGGQPGSGSQHGGGRQGGIRGHRRGGHHGGPGAGGRRHDGERRQVGGRWRRMRLQRRSSRVGGGGHWRGGRWCHGRAGRTRAGQDRTGRYERHWESQNTDLGIFIPECHPENGSFLSEQCNVTSGVCWCVDKDGEEKPNTRAQVQRGTRECGDAGKLHVETNTFREKKRVARLSFSLTGNFEDLVGNQEQFINNLKEKVASICRCKKEQIRNVKILPGSIKVKMEIVAGDDGILLEESIQLLNAEITFLRFVIIFSETEYRADGSFEAHVIAHHHANDSGHPRGLLLVEIISIGSCTTAFLLVTLFFAWKYFGRSKKKMSEGWKDMVKVKPPEVHYVTPDP